VIDSKLTIPVQIRKAFGRGGTYTAQLGPIVGHGRTQAEAKQNLAGNLQAALAAASVDPAFARDDDGSLIVALPHYSGVIHWRIDERGPRSITGCDGPPRESLATVPHYTLLGPAA
jgi:hypothetical protein